MSLFDKFNLHWVFSPGVLALPDRASSSSLMQPFMCVSASVQEVSALGEITGFSVQLKEGRAQEIGKRIRLTGKKENKQLLLPSLSQGDKFIPCEICVCGKDDN